MSLGIVDLATVAIIEDAFEFLSKNPRHLEFILSMYCRYPLLQKLVGTEHIKQCMEYVINNQIHVAPFYEMDLKKRPSIVVISSGTESQQFIGDYGTQEKQTKVLKPIIYAEFDAKKIGTDTISVAASYNLDQKLWVGVHVAQGDQVFKLRGILKKDKNTTVLHFDEDLPEGLSLKGWKAQSADREKGYVINASIDDVTVQMKLTTNGDFSVHRLMALVLRYAIKSRRLKFDEFGMQVANFSYSPPMSTDPEEQEFESVFTLTAKFTDHWIDREFDLPDSAANIDVCLTASSDEENKEDVDLNE